MTLQDYQVLQRDSDNKARVTLATGEVVELAVGGPYEVDGAKNVLVGDLWLLAGQSNMEGCGRLVDIETPGPGVHSFQSCEQWGVAEDPLHWLGESPRIVHHILWGADALPSETPVRDPNRDRGSGAGLTFAKLRYAETGVPIGLIPAAHGGTSMAQWDPALKDQGDRCLYAAAVSRVQDVGGKIAGILWYQGESDAFPHEVASYAARMEALAGAFRSDFGQPKLPFYFVQLGRFVGKFGQETFDGWNGMREAQRNLPTTIPHSAVVTAIDLGLDDLIHIDTAGLKLIGKRLSEVAAGRPAPDFGSVSFKSQGRTLRVSFTNIQGSLRAAGRPSGFTLREPDGQEIFGIFKISLDGDAALLHLTDEAVPAGAQLWYGWGVDPYCNVTDSVDAAVPAFGPVPLPAELFA